MAQMKEINGFTGYYIDTNGKLFTEKKGLRNKKGELRELKPSKKKTGYLYA